HHDILVEVLVSLRKDHTSILILFFNNNIIISEVFTLHLMVRDGVTFLCGIPGIQRTGRSLW
ncbi:unnamed protein product, partial [Staurois parvus]